MFDHLPGDGASEGARLMGAFLGVLASMLMVAPEGTKNALYRSIGGLVLGFVFSPVIPNIYFMSWLGGDDFYMTLARATFSGLVVWFVLEFIARMLSSTEWLEKLAKEILANRGKK